MIETKNIKIVKELRQKHKLADARPKAARDAQGAAIAPPLDEMIAYSKKLRVYRAELRSRLTEEFRKQFEPMMQAAIARKQAKEKKAEGENGPTD